MLRDRHRRERVAERIRSRARGALLVGGRVEHSSNGGRARLGARRPHTKACVLDELRVARLLSGQLGREDHRAAACRALGDGVWTRLSDDDRRGRDESERILDEALNAHRGPVGRVRLLEPRLERGVTPADRDDAPAARSDERRERAHALVDTAAVAAARDNDERRIGVAAERAPRGRARLVVRRVGVNARASPCARGRDRWRGQQVAAQRHAKLDDAVALDALLGRETRDRSVGSDIRVHLKS